MSKLLRPRLLLLAVSSSLSPLQSAPVPARHGPEVPKFVFMAVGFETYGHASRMAQLITFSVESPPTYILLNLKNSISVHLNRTPTGPDI